MQCMHVRLSQSQGSFIQMTSTKVFMNTSLVSKEEIYISFSFIFVILDHLTSGSMQTTALTPPPPSPQTKYKLNTFFFVSQIKSV